MLRGAQGRWNTRRPRLPCLYTALSPQGAIAEFEKHVAEYRWPRERTLVSLDVSVGPVLNLTSALIRARLAVSLDTLVGDAPADVTVCRIIAREHVLDGPYQAILAPAAALKGGINLMIYIASTSGIQELSDGPDRVRISPGFQWPGE